MWMNTQLKLNRVVGESAKILPWLLKCFLTIWTSKVLYSGGTQGYFSFTTGNRNTANDVEDVEVS